jgi:AraC family transcriptional regulator
VTVEPTSATEPCLTDHTMIERLAAVQRSVGRMRGSISDEHSLPNLARSALLSPFHFHRVFRQLTAATPARFLAALRMAEAKRLLVYSSMSVTDICMQVGYSSLGTFTTQFTRLVGMSPRRFRQLITPVAGQRFADILTMIRPALPEPARTQVTGIVTGGPGGGMLAVAGLFPSGIPQERPAACAIVPPPSIAAFGNLDDGEYYPLTMSFAPPTTVAEALVREDPDLCFVGDSPTPVRIREGRAVSQAPFRVQLRPRRPIDPPLVLALPLLLAAEPTYASHGQDTLHHQG